MERATDRNLVGSIEVTCRSDIAEIVQIRNPKVAAVATFLKIYFELLLLNQKANWLRILLEAPGQSETQIPAMVTILKMHFELLQDVKANWLKI